MAAGQISKEQIKQIYGLGAALGILERGNPDDSLHALVESLTGKSSVSQLTAAQGQKVIKSLRSQSQKGKKQYSAAPGGMTEGQQRKVWKLMYELARYSPSDSAVGERLCGVIRRQTGINAVPAAPFQWMDYKQGSRLIEALKKYVEHVSSHEKDGGAGDGAEGTARASPAGGSGE